MIGCTNQPLTALDEAILRPGRLEVHVHLPLPSPRDRRAIVEAIAAAADGIELVAVRDCVACVGWDGTHAWFLTFHLFT